MQFLIFQKSYCFPLFKFFVDIFYFFLIIVCEYFRLFGTLPDSSNSKISWTKSHNETD